MAKTALYSNWTWKRSLPKPFDTEEAISKTTYSRYCTVSPAKATLHSASLSAILAYMEMDTSVSSGSSSSSAIGTQGDKIIAEYQSRTGEIHAVIFNQKNGKFTAGRFDDPDSAAKVYSLKDSGNTGTALIFSLLPIAMEDDEFKENYDILAACKLSGFPDMDKADQAAYILCDNLYRRIENADSLGRQGISLSINATGNIPSITPLNLAKGAYSPTSVLFGDFQILKPGSTVAATLNIDKNSFIGQYSFSDRTYSRKEQQLIPTIEDWYVIPPEVENICKHAKLTSNSIQPMRNFLLRGPAGTGKTEGAKAIAAGLKLPYLFYTCSANSEIFDLVGQMLPVTEDTISFPETSVYPSLEDIQMDPPTAYCKLTGEYVEDITEAEVYDKLIEVITLQAQTKETDQDGSQRFRYVESPLIEAIRKGYLIEIQEPTVIANPGVLVGLNGLLDRCASITLPTGEVVRRHPDTVIVVTTNTSYAGCRDINQSVISRMNLVMDIEEPDTNTLVQRIINITGCPDTAHVTEMATTIKDIAEHCRETMITDGSCGVRELVSWVQSYMICGSIMEAANYTVLSCASSDPENRAEILSSCLEGKFDTAA